MTERRQAVLDTLKSTEEPMSIVEIARHLQVHTNTVRFHLESLVRDGRVEQVDQAPVTPGRPPLMFRALRAMDPSGPRSYQALADALATRMSAKPDVTGEAMRAGIRWGARLAVERASSHNEHDLPAIEHLLAILNGLGFSPENRTMDERPQIKLHHCPFLDLIPEHQDVICPLHLGLMQGAMSAMGAELTVDRLEPFAEPDLCLAHMRNLVEAS
ncbi:MAG: helix-turn-helix domain-containing protein [Aeromicrobium sp.]